MLPKTLDQWTLQIIEELLAQGYYETEFFDFKEMLPYSKNDAEKARLSKSCCAFANSSGGFLIFGVKDDRSLSPKNRLVGIDQTIEIPEHFGSYPKNCNPSIPWHFLNPPLQMDNGNVIHIFEIPRSWNAPHCIEVMGHRGSDVLRCFTKRTHKGNEDMSYEEIRTAFLQYYEKRLKLQLLYAELRTIKENANWLSQVGHGNPRLGEFGLTVLEITLADTYTLMIQEPELLFDLTQIRTLCRQVNNKIQSILPIYHLELGDREGVNASHNAYVSGRCENIIRFCDTALECLKKLISE